MDGIVKQYAEDASKSLDDEIRTINKTGHWADK